MISMTAQTYELQLNEQLFTPFPGLEGLELYAGVILPSKNKYAMKRFTQKNNLVFFDLEKVGVVAENLRPKKPTKEFLELSPYKKERASLLYSALRGQVWQHGIMPVEWLQWEYDKPSPAARSNRFIKVEDEWQDAVLRSYLIKNWVAGYKDIAIVEPEDKKEVKWPTADGDITPDLAKLFGLPSNTFVYTDPDTKKADGVRSLLVAFRYREWPSLYSVWGPLDRDDDVGCLVGRVVG